MLPNRKTNLENALSLHACLRYFSIKGNKGKLKRFGENDFTD